MSGTDKIQYQTPTLHNIFKQQVFSPNSYVHLISMTNKRDYLQAAQNAY